MNWQDWYDDSVANIRNTVRPYLKQTILLVNASRSIQTQFRSLATDPNDEKDLKKVMKHVSEALKAARDPAVLQKRNEEVDKIFDTACQEILKFCMKYQIILDEDMDKAIKEDRTATTNLQAAKILSEKAVKTAKSKVCKRILFTFWPSDMQNWKDKSIIFEFKIENGTKLDHVLARVLQKSMLKRVEYMPHVDLIRNPGLFTAIPLTLKDFAEGKQSKRHKHSTKTLCQLGSQDEIHDQLRALHLLLDPSNLPEPELTKFDAENQKIIKRNYRNIWKLDDRGDYFAAAREISGCLVPLNPKKPLPVPRLEPPQRPKVDAPKQPLHQQQPTDESPRRPIPPPPQEPVPEQPVLRPPIRPSPQEPVPQQPIIRPPPPPQQQKPIPKTGSSILGIFNRPQKPVDPPPPPPPEIYRSHNAMEDFKLNMVDDLPKKKRWFW